MGACVVCVRVRVRACVHVCVHVCTCVLCSLACQVILFWTEQVTNANPFSILNAKTSNYVCSHTHKPVTCTQRTIPMHTDQATIEHTRAHAHKPAGTHTHTMHCTRAHKPSNTCAHMHKPAHMHYTHAHRSSNYSVTHMHTRTKSAGAHTHTTTLVHTDTKPAELTCVGPSPAFRWSFSFCLIRYSLNGDCTYGPM